MEIENLINEIVEKTATKKINKLIKQAVMQEVNGLGIRAVLKEEITKAGISKEDIKDLIEKSVDSYVRSANIENLVENLIADRVEKAVKEKLKEYMDIGCFSRPTSLLNRLITECLEKQFKENFTANVSIVKNGERFNTK